MIPPFIAELVLWVGEEPHLWPHGIDKLFGPRAGYPLGESPRKLDVTTIVLGGCDAVVMSFVI